MPPPIILRATFLLLLPFTGMANVPAIATLDFLKRLIFFLLTTVNTYSHMYIVPQEGGCYWLPPLDIHQRIG